MLSTKHLKDVCLYDCGHLKCRFLAQDENDKKIYYCLKKSSNAVEIDHEVNEYLKDCSKKKIDPKNKSAPIGDNCGGYPVLKNITQGYDQD